MKHLNLSKVTGMVRQKADEVVGSVFMVRQSEMAGLDCQGPNQTKFLSRCGVALCQGRMCGLAITQILATALNKTPEQVGAYRIRTSLKLVRWHRWPLCHPGTYIGLTAIVFLCVLDNVICGVALASMALDMRRSV